MRAIYEAALMYVKGNLPVVPLRANEKGYPSKRQLTGGLNLPSNAAKSVKAVETMFNPETGYYAGWNIGIAAGKETGLNIIDIDVKDIDGHQSWDEMLQEQGVDPDLVTPPTQTTPTGGSHLFFQWCDGLTSRANGLGHGLDIRTGTKTMYKSHVVAFPSTINNERYVWVTGGEVHGTPAAVMDTYHALWRSKEVVGSPISMIGGDRDLSGTKARGSELMTNDDQIKPISPEPIQRMLKDIDPDDMGYDEWLKVGMALHSQDDGPEGLRVWDVWSQRGKRYKNRECAVRWQGFQDQGTVTMGTLVYYAGQSGWKATPEDTIQSPANDFIDSWNEKFLVVPIGNKAKIVQVLTAEDRARDPQGTHYKEWLSEDFEMIFGNGFITVAGKEKQMTKYWRSHPRRRTCLQIEMEAFDLYPAKRRDPTVFDMWGGFSVEPNNTGLIDKYLQHVEEVICDGDERMSRWVLDWIADMIQDPLNPKGTAISIFSIEQGTGKGLFVAPLLKLLGENRHGYHIYNQELLIGRFAEQAMSNKVLVLADEVVWGGDTKLKGKIKGMITESRFVAEGKGDPLKGSSFRNCRHFILASNERQSTPLEESNNRRFLVLQVSNKRVGDTAYFNAYAEQMNSDENLGALLNYFQNRKYDKKMLRTAPQTAASVLQKQHRSMHDPFNQWLATLVDREYLVIPNRALQEGDDDGADGWPHEIRVKTLEENWLHWSEHHGYKSNNGSWARHRAKLTSDYGFAVTSRRSAQTPHSSRSRIWDVPPIEEFKELVLARTGYSESEPVSSETQDIDKITIN